MQYIKNDEIKSYYQLKQIYPNFSFPKESPPDGWKIYTPPEPTLEEVKRRKKSQINNERNQRETAGFLYLDKTFDSDERSAHRMQVAALAAQKAINDGASLTITWTVKDNSTIVLTAEQIIGMVASFAEHGQFIFETAKAYKAQVDAVKVEEGEEDESAAKARVNAIIWE